MMYLSKFKIYRKIRRLMGARVFVKKEYGLLNAGTTKTYVIVSGMWTPVLIQELKKLDFYEEK